MSNIASITNKPKPVPTIGDLKPGQHCYTVPWAVEGDNVDENFHQAEYGGTATVKIECIKRGLYAVTYC